MARKDDDYYDYPQYGDSNDDAIPKYPDDPYEFGKGVASAFNAVTSYQPDLNIPYYSPQPQPSIDYGAINDYQFDKGANESVDKFWRGLTGQPNPYVKTGARQGEWRPPYGDAKTLGGVSDPRDAIGYGVPQYEEQQPYQEKLVPWRWSMWEKPYEEVAYIPPYQEPAYQEVKPRSEERRVGKECRSRWSPYH